jgi:hypothetical protein
MQDQRPDLSAREINVAVEAMGPHNPKKTIWSAGRAGFRIPPVDSDMTRRNAQ